MEIIAMYCINENEYELYRAASGDYCVSVYKCGKSCGDFNLGSIASALEFILKDYEVKYES